MMRRFSILIFAAILATAGVHAQRNDDTRALRQQIEALTRRVNNAEGANRQLRDEIATMRQEHARHVSLLETRLDSMERANAASDSAMSAQVLEVRHNHEAATERVNNAWMSALIGLALLTLALFTIWWLITRRLKRNVATIGQISDAQQKLSEESVKLDTQLLQLMDKQLALAQVQVSAHATAAMNDNEHSLALKVADEIVRIEMNLNRMDPDTRGLKQLSKAVDRIRDNFLSRGYEIVEMLGKPYVEGVKASVSFEDDESLPEGTRVITRIVKPQVNYNGVMIQAAQITVSQNI